MTDNLVPSESKCSTSFAIENGNLKNGPVCGKADYLILISKALFIVFTIIAIDVSDRSMLSFTAETSTDSLNDRDLNSCIWFKRGDMLAVKFPEKYHFVRATLVSQASHKGIGG
jgi:hypothetical protein